MKDPAALLYIDKWLVSTKGMKGNAKGWYLNLILYQYDKGELPNDIEELANLCDVRISEFEEFKQVFNQVLKQKFIVNDNGCLQNEFANEILRKRETFKEKRSDAGKLGYVIKYYRNNYKHKEGFEEYLKENLVIDFDIKNNQMLKQVLKQNYKLYINKDKDINKDNNIEIRKENFKEDLKPFLEIYGKDLLNDFFLYWTEMNQGGKKMRFEMQSVFDINRRLITWHKNSTKNNFSPTQKTAPLISDTSEVDKARRLQAEYLNSLKKHETLIK